MKKIDCKYCRKELSKDEIALSKKILGRNIESDLCISCLADYVGCEEDDLLVKIEEFREQGCVLFN